MKFKVFVIAALILCLFLNKSYSQTNAKVNQVTERKSEMWMGYESLIESNSKALDIINRAANASGGLEKIKNFKSTGFDYEGEVAATYQGLNPKEPHKNLPYNGRLVFDIANNKLFNYSETKWKYFTFVSNSVYKDGKTYNIEERGKTYRSSDSDEVFETWEFGLALLLIRHLLENPMSLRYEGQQKAEGQIFNVVSSTLKGNKIYRFYFSSDSDRLIMIEYLDYSPNFGDMMVKTIFSNFQSFNELVMPTNVKSFYNNDLVADVTYKNILFNNNVKLDKIALPENYRLAEGTSNAPEMKNREIAQDVYLIENLAGRDYNVMFANLGDFLIVFEAPLDNWASKVAEAEIRKIFPQKPIRYVMVTHFHDDHATGIRKYMSDGVTVITTPGNKSYFEKVAALKHTFHPENNSFIVSQPKFEIVRNNFHEIKGKTMSVQFLDLGPTSHADEIIIAYIPEKNIIFQGDFFRVSANRNEPESLRDEGLVFYQKIKDKKLKFTQLVSAHGAIGDMSDLEKSYQVRMQKK